MRGASKAHRSRGMRVVGAAVVLAAVAIVLAASALADFSYSSEFGGPSTIGRAAEIAVVPSGTIYVGDPGNNVIDEFDQQGNSLGTIGPSIPGYPGGSSSCSGNPAWCFLLFKAGVATDSVGDIYVADNGNQRVIKLDPTGHYLATIGTSFTDPNGTPDSLGRPIGVAVSGAYLYVVDSGTNSPGPRVVEFTTAGTFVRIIGSTSTGTPGACDGGGR